jgi:hypothetical protein
MSVDVPLGAGKLNDLEKHVVAPDSTTGKPIHPLSSKVTAVLSTSYSDAEFRDVVSLIDSRKIQNDGKTRRQLRTELTKEVIDRNGEVLDEFGRVAEVSRTPYCLIIKLKAD